MLSIAILALLLTAPADDSLVLHYRFDDGAVRTVTDHSGRGNDGEIRGAFEYTDEGLAFNGRNTHINAGSDESLALDDAGTLAVWCKPDAIQGGLITWVTGSGWPDARLMLGFNNYGLVYKDLFVAIADGSWCQSFYEAHIPGKWTHLAVTFDGEYVRLYRDGRELQAIGQDFAPATQGVPVRIGFIDGVGDAYFKGLMREVRVYRRTLSAKEVRGMFREHPLGKGLSDPQPVTVTPQLHAREGELRVACNFGEATAAAPGYEAKIALWNVQDKTWAAEQWVKIDEQRRASFTFPIANLAPGLKELRLTVFKAGRVPVGIESSTPFYLSPRAKPPKGGKVLNNLVVELVRQAADHATFENPRDGWVLVRAEAQDAIRISIDDSDAVDGPEAFRHLPAGQHTVRVTGGTGGTGGDVQSLVVRSIPELMSVGYPSPSLAGYGHYAWDFLEKHVNPHITTHVASIDKIDKKILEQWHARGKRWMLEQNLPHLVHRNQPVTGDVAFDWWTKNAGFEHPLASGLVADEFSEGDHPAYHGYIDATRRIDADPRFADRTIFMWLASRTMHSVDALSKRFVNALFQTRFKVAYEAYLSEKATMETAQHYIHNKLARQHRLWRENYPATAARMVHVVGYLSAPPETANVNPNVDYKVFQDLQFHHLANHPDCFGLYGVMMYKARYAEEEALRWSARLFRHYCIEGNTGLLSQRYGYKYRLEHIRNGDFDDGLEHWNAQPAEPESIGTRHMTGAGRMQGRMVAAAGNNFLWMRQSDKGATRVTQTIRDLKPGALYSLKLMAIDWQDWQAGVSKGKKLPLNIEIEGGEIVPQRTFMYPNHSFIRSGPFARPDSGVAYHNHHVIVFRATAAEGKLNISDTSGTDGRELAFNFVELQPHYWEE